MAATTMAKNLLPSEARRLGWGWGSGSWVHVYLGGNADNVEHFLMRLPRRIKICTI